MRRVLVDYARKRGAEKRGAGRGRVSLDDMGEAMQAIGDERLEEVVALDELLGRLSAHDPRASDIVQFRVFGGLRHREIAEVLGLSEATVRRSCSRPSTPRPRCPNNTEPLPRRALRLRAL